MEPEENCSMSFILCSAFSFPHIIRKDQINDVMGRSCRKRYFSNVLKTHTPHYIQTTLRKLLLSSSGKESSSFRNVLWCMCFWRREKSFYLLVICYKLLRRQIPLCSQIIAFPNFGNDLNFLKIYIQLASYPPPSSHSIKPFSKQSKGTPEERNLLNAVWFLFTFNSYVSSAALYFDVKKAFNATWQSGFLCKFLTIKISVGIITLINLFFRTEKSTFRL